MEKDWIKINASTNESRIEMARQALIANNIDAVVLNKKDSSYLFGSSELYVSRENEEEAKLIIKDFFSE